MNRSSSACKSCASLTDGNNNWRGGKVRHKAGYVMVLTKDHPRSKPNNRYVFEHILVMEESLGRYLLEHENVHHRNGQKDDNRIENLELWSRSQPAGQRVEDKVRWAREIIELYG